MTPQMLSLELLHIAAKIDGSREPSIALVTQALESVLHRMGASVQLTMKRGGSRIQDLMNLSEALKSNGIVSDKMKTVYFEDDGVRVTSSSGDDVFVKYE